MKFRSRYDLGAPERGLEFTQPSLTQQQFKEDCDIEELLKRHNLGNVMGLFQQNVSEPMYADVSDVPDFHESQNHVARATEYFAALPSAVRTRFNNSLPEFLSALNNPESAKELQDLGILAKPEHKAETQPMPSGKQPAQTGSDAVGDAHLPTGSSTQGVEKSTPPAT